MLVVTGADGDFCSGADLADAGFGPGAGVSANVAWMRRPAVAATALHRLAAPTIAAVDGVAAGAGMNLAIGCDIVIATERARFTEIFVRRGLTLDFGGTWLLPHIVGRARGPRSRPHGEDRRRRRGARHGAGSAGGGGRRARGGSVGRRRWIWRRGRRWHKRLIKTGIDRAPAMTFEQAIANESQAQGVLLSSADAAEALEAFRAKRDPHFDGR